MSEKRNQYGYPYEDRGAVMLGVVMAGVSAGLTCFLFWLGWHSWR